MSAQTRIRVRAARLMHSHAMAALAQDRLDRDGYVIRADLYRDALYVAAITEAFSAGPAAGCVETAQPSPRVTAVSTEPDNKQDRAAPPTQSARPDLDKKRG